MYLAHRFYTPLGCIGALVHERKLIRLTLAENVREWTELLRRYDAHETKSELLLMVRQQVLEYLSGQRRDFDLPLAPEGSRMQRDVWEAMTRTRYGQTVSYTQLAQMAEHPGAIRAVGTACGANPLPLVIPCHRILRKDGSLGGYSMGGLSVKQQLLALEQGQPVEHPVAA